jgi:hypothetical protein
MISAFAGNAVYAVMSIPFTADPIEIREKFGILHGYGDWDNKMALRVDRFLDLSFRAGVVMNHIEEGTFTVAAGISNSLVMVLIKVSTVTIGLLEKDPRSYLWDFKVCYLDTPHEISLPFAHRTKPKYNDFLRYDLFYTPEIPDDEWPLYINNPILKEFFKEKVIR